MGQVSIEDDNSIFSWAVENAPRRRDTLLVSRENANDRVQKIFRTIIECEADPIKRDSIKQVYGIKEYVYRDALSDLHFTDTGSKSQWDLIPGNTWKFAQENDADIFISKPVYFKGSEFAAAEVRLRNIGVIQIYRRINGVWTEFGTICQTSFTPKARLRKKK